MNEAFSSEPVLTTNSNDVSIDDSPKMMDDAAFEQMFETYISNFRKEKIVTTGVVVGYAKNDIRFDIGAKCEDLAPISEFKYDPEYSEKLPEIGEKLQVYIEKLDQSNSIGGASESSIVLSREKALRQIKWEEFENAMNTRKALTGYILGKNKNNFFIDVVIDGVYMSMPYKFFDNKPIFDVNAAITSCLNQPQHFLIIKMDKQKNNIMVSRKAVLDGQDNDAIVKSLDSVEEGEILEGVVKSFAPYGAFIDLSKSKKKIAHIDGLLHITDIAWQRINHSSEKLSIGEEVRVKVLSIDREKRRISLGLKQLSKSPWAGIADKIKVGSKIKGPISNITDYGLFVELSPGIEGLVYLSELSWGKKIRNPRELFRKGQMVEVVVLDINENTNRSSLSIKQCQSSPWKKFAETHKINDIIDGTVNNIVDFGIFVNLAENIDGLVHISDITWTGVPEQAIRNYKPGNKVKVKLLYIDEERERMSLGIKQINDDPMEKGIYNYKVGQIINCVVYDIKNDVVEVEIARGINARIETNELLQSNDNNPIAITKDAKIKAKIIKIIPEKRLIFLTMKNVESAE